MSVQWEGPTFCIRCEVAFATGFGLLCRPCRKVERDKRLAERAEKRAEKRQPQS